jgi:L-alanine-DL-glutamate epimerase-like enolase superfamily enzyme
MRITEVKAFALSFKLDNAPRRGVGQPIKKDTVIVRVKTEDGITGYGEAHHALAPTLVAELVNQMERKAVDVIQPDPCKAGGITETKKIADRAAAFRCAFAPHVGMSAIDASAGVHLLCATSNALIYESDCSAFNPFRDELCSGHPQVVDGYIEPSEAPGLGFEVDESLFAKLPGIAGSCYI